MTKQALARGYAVAALSSADRRTGGGARCFQWGADAPAAAAAAQELPHQLGLPAGAPVYAMGTSSGGSLALRLPRLARLDGVVGRECMPPVLAWLLQLPGVQGGCCGCKER